MFARLGLFVLIGFGFLLILLGLASIVFRESAYTIAEENAEALQSTRQLTQQIIVTLASPTKTPTIKSTTPIKTQTPSITLSPTSTKSENANSSYYPDKLAEYMIERINQDRMENGLRPVALDNLAAEVGRQHAQDMINNNYFSHHNLSGYGPDHRYYFNRGQHVVMENTALFSNQYSDGSGVPFEDWYALIDRIQNGFMESPGHRANILDQAHTHVGIGMAYSSSTGQFRLNQEFTNHYIELDSEIPEQVALGDSIRINGQFTNEVYEYGNLLIDLSFEKFPIPIPKQELAEPKPYQSLAQSIETRRIDKFFDETFKIEVDMPSGMYHIRIFADIDGKQYLLFDRIVSAY